MNAHEVFISYSATNESLALVAAKALETAGVPCWIAVRDLVPGIGYGGQIFRAIEHGRVLVLLLTRQSNTSPHVQREVEYAAHCRLKLLVFEAESVVLDPDLDYFLHNTHRLSGVNPDAPMDSFPRLLEVAKALLADGPKAPPAERAGRESERGPVYGPFEVLRREDGAGWCELGSGPGGTTFKALDVRTRRLVALKVIPHAAIGNTPEIPIQLAERVAKARLLRDARVSPLLETGQAEGSDFQAWLYVEGESLQTLVEREGPLVPVRALRIGWQIARALEAISRAGLMHGDLKPANVLIARLDEEEMMVAVHGQARIKVVDLRLVEGLVGTGTNGGTESLAGRATVTLDSPGFASPEKCRQQPLDIRSDFYALGTLLWYLLTGAPPFEGTPLQIVFAQIGQPPPFELLVNASPDVTKLLGWMLEKDRTRRPPDASSLIKAIEITGRGLLKTTTAPLPEDATKQLMVMTNPPVGGTVVRDGPAADETFAARTMIVPRRPLEGSRDSQSKEGHDSMIFASLVPGAAPGIARVTSKESATTGAAGRFGHYEVMRRTNGSLLELGRGAMGITYKAMDTDLRVPVALKVVRSELMAGNPSARDRFMREARAAASLRHPNVATVYHLGSSESEFFYAMEFVDGETVDARVRRTGPLDLRLALEIVIQTASALSAAFQSGLVHRDIKPMNLMIVENADQDMMVKLIDFGLARLSMPQDEEITHAGGFVGTPLYASPEQVEENVVDTRSDIYSLGVTLWFMLAGAPPFTGSFAKIMAQHLSGAPPFDTLAKLGVPDDIIGLLRRMLAKDPADRPQTPAELRTELRAVYKKLTSPVNEPVAAAPVPPAQTPPVVPGPRKPGPTIGQPRGWRKRFHDAWRSLFQ